MWQVHAQFLVGEGRTREIATPAAVCPAFLKGTFALMSPAGFPDDERNRAARRPWPAGLLRLHQAVPGAQGPHRDAAWSRRTALLPGHDARVRHSRRQAGDRPARRVMRRTELAAPKRQPVRRTLA